MSNQSEISIPFGKTLLQKYTPQRVKMLLDDLGLLPTQVEYDNLFSNDAAVIKTITKTYLKTKLKNTILFCLFLFTSIITIIYSLFHKKNIDSNVSSLILLHLTKISFSFSLLSLMLMLANNYRKQGLFLPTHMKYFLVSFFVYTLSILIYRKYTILAEANKYEILIESYFYTYLGLISVSVLDFVIPV